ncbi:MAG: DUF1553 domain-containing protein [Bacteroidetes bacterium]|nr:DUF1553 domain-containing protein [Bacteroidota bacterium]
MKFRLSKKLILIVLLSALVGVLYLYISPSPKIDFNTQVKPIFNKKCITCHGGVKKQGGFSLLFREEALAPAKSGKLAIVPGHPGQSELIKRITNSDPDERMPYQHAPLSNEEITLLKRWIKQGATWGVHWAYTPVKKEEVPDHSNAWIKTDIDQFVFDKAKEQNLTPSPAADKATLLRRVSLDLTGLPPADSVAQKYLSDNTDKAFDHLVDALLASPAYGERWTSLWLDLCRYGDTKGYESDQPRTIWRYRDWLINAFNQDKPYNDFLVEQLAGDLLPDPDDALYTATAFHRNTMTNDEGGTENEEFRNVAIIDRVNTTWSALMGTTFSCVQCHSHPYDPFKQEEYYKFLAFFNNSRDEDTDMDYPLLRQYDSTDQQKFNAIIDWIKNNVSAARANEYSTFLKTLQPTVNAAACDNFTNAALSGYTQLRNNGSCRLPGITLDQKDQLLFRYMNIPGDATWYIYLDSLNGKLLATVPLANTRSDWKISAVPLPPATGKHDLYFKYYSPSIKSADDPGVLFDWMQFGQAFPGKGLAGYEITKQHFFELLGAKTETTPVMMENNSEQFRNTYIFERGNWSVKGAVVTPGVPHILNPLPEGVPQNRLGMALWLTDKKNPLTARTMVNRLWEQLFGRGLAETLEDLGTQGIPPTHRELLDYLSWKFMTDYNWSIKKMLKEIVLSATYQQQSKFTPEQLQNDPNNIYLTRGPRVRLSAEQLRDQGLAVSQLLSKKMFGKSVMPYQPDNIWRSPYNWNKWEMSKDEDQYRRALYTYWKRTAPYPSMITFDGGSREVCITRRIRTNTPLQALTTLNDSAYLVMARGLALRMQKAGKEVKQQIQQGYEAMLYKPMQAKKLEAMVDLYTLALTKYKTDQQAANEMMGDKKQKAEPESAALTVVANALLNLDEWLNKN